MELRNTTFTYGAITKTFHWLLFVLITFMLIFGFLLDSIPKPFQGTAFTIHKLTGLTILALMVLRLLWALVNPKPALPFGTPWYEHVLERVVHWLIYLTLIAMPLAGWIGSVAAGYPPKLGEYAFNLPIEKDKALSESAFDWHNTIAFIIIGLLVLHILAALYHHYVRKDDILRRMLP